MFGYTSTLSGESVCMLVGVEYLLATSGMLGTERRDWSLQSGTSGVKLSLSSTPLPEWFISKLSFFG
jgi:hypothetical protein